MEQTIEADKRLIERCKEVDYEKELEVLRSEWPTEKFEVDESKGFCPTCGQPLPQEQWQEKIEQMRSSFNQRKEAKKKELNERAAKIKEQQAQASEELKRLEDKLSADTEQLETIKHGINCIFADKQDLEKIVIKTVDELLAESTEFNELSAQIEQLKEQQATVTEDNTDGLRDLRDMKSTLMDDVDKLQQQLATRQQYVRINAFIDGIKEEEKDLVKQLSELERKEDVARQYQFRQNQLLEERINQHFKLVQWKLFKTINNGGDSFEDPFCECYVDGVGYHSGLNQAARLNAGLDICEALCRFYKVSAPIVIDNAESNLDIYPTTGQQLRLQVYDSELNLV
jgi:chromosome segregation ATPase